MKKNARLELAPSTTTATVLAALLAITALLAQTSFAQQDATTQISQSEAKQKPRSYIDENEPWLLASALIHLGPTFGSATSGEIEKNVSLAGKPRLLFGAGIQVGLGALFFVQPEINYMQRSYSTSDQAGKTRFETTTSLHYLNFPLLAKARIKIDQLRPYLVAGPALSILTSSNDELSTEDADGTERSLNQRSEGYSSMLLSAVLGGGVEFEMTSRLSLTLDLRYDVGLTNALNRNDSSRVSLKTSSFQLLGGAQFYL